MKLPAESMVFPFLFDAKSKTLDEIGYELFSWMTGKIAEHLMLSQAAIMQLKNEKGFHPFR